MEDEDKEEKERHAEEERRKQEQEKSHVQEQEQQERKRHDDLQRSQMEEDQKQKGRQQDMFNLGNDLDSLPGEEHKQPDEDTTGCDYVEESEEQIEPCQDVPSEQCGTYCIKSAEGIRRVQGVRKEFMGQNKQ